MTRRAKIVATLGPASADERVVGRLIKGGVDVARLNLSHGDHDEHLETLARVRRVAQELGRHIPVIMDLMGPRHRLGRIEEGPRVLKRGERVSIGDPSQGADLPVDDPELVGHLRRGERVLIDNGLIELKIESKKGLRATARVVVGGPVSTRKGINIPDSSPPFTISEKDRADVGLAVEAGVDYLAASYVGRGDDVEALRALVAGLGGNLPVIAKLERGRAVNHIDEIVAAADAVMVARGDLGVEVPLHRVPVLQKRIVEAGRRLGKPVIVATQMLESMVQHPRPTRAESSDVANAVFDGADALMLSGETAAGRYPVEAVRTMARIIREAESYQRKGRMSGVRRGPRPRPAALLPLTPGDAEIDAATSDSSFEIADAVAAAAVFTAQSLDVRRIVAFSQGGFTARMIARYRPVADILAFTTDQRIARRVQLLWGVRPLMIREEIQHHDEVVELVDRRLTSEKLVKPGEAIVVLMGDPIRERPLTNLMRVHRVRPLAG